MTPMICWSPTTHARLTGIKLIERIRQGGMSLPVICASSSFFAWNLRNIRNSKSPHHSEAL